jgi:hypothetical protein
MSRNYSKKARVLLWRTKGITKNKEFDLDKIQSLGKGGNNWNNR